MNTINSPEHVFYYEHASSGLKAFVVVDSTARGPAFGPCRMRPYGSDIEAAEEAMKLGAALTRKAALASLPCGGGACTIMETGKNRSRRLSEFSSALATLAGKLTVGGDMGINHEDLILMRRKAPNVLQEQQHIDPSAMTAHGIFHAINATLSRVGLGSSLKGLTVAVQGLGKVGSPLARILKDQGCKLIVTAAHEEKARSLAKHYGATYVSPQEITAVECDIFAPCALGGILNHDTASTLRCRLIAGSANNQLAEAGVVEELEMRGIVYLPDYAVNAGGLITAYHTSGNNCSEQDIMHALVKIGTTARQILDLTSEKYISTTAAAERLAAHRLARRT